MSNKLVLYSASISPPCRFVLMTLKSLGLKAEVLEVDLFKGENKTSEYTKLNPKQQVPTLLDNQLTLWDSHAICTYLMNKYGSQDSRLYPMEPSARSLVDQMLCFNMTHFFPANSAAMGSFFKTGKKPAPSDDLWRNVVSSYKLLEIYLQRSAYLSADKITLADLCCLATITSSELLVPLDDQETPLTAVWLQRCKETPVHIGDNQPGVDRLKNMINTWTI